MSFLRNSLTSLLLNSNLTKLHSIQPTQTRYVKRWVAPTLRELRKRKEKMGPEEPQPRSRFIEWNYNSELFAFGKRLQENFDNGKLQTAFVNRSFIVQEEARQRELGIEDPKINLEDNAKLRQKGEKLLSEYVKAFLEYSLPNAPRDAITAFSNYLKSEDVLSNVSSHLGIKDLVLSSDPSNVENDVLKDTFLAVIGALQESSGDERAYSFIRDFVCTQLNQKDLTELWHIEDPVDLLAQVCKEKDLGEPEPRLIGESAKNTVLAAYHVGIYVNKKMIGSGFGEDINTAITTASLNSLWSIFGIRENMKPFNFNLQLEKIASKESKKQIQ